MAHGQQQWTVYMSDNTVKDTRDIAAANSEFNALSYMIETLINQNICTADIVRVVNVTDGYVDVLPLITQVDAFDNAVQPAPLYHLPYRRVQGGRAALIIDPVVGDIGLAVYTKRDSSGLIKQQSVPSKPASFRTFNQADGFYIGGFLNQMPEVYLELTQEGTAVLSAPISVTIYSPDCEVNSSSFKVNTSDFEVNAALIKLNAGSTQVSGMLNVVGGISGGGGATMSGGITNTGGTVTSNGITLETHTHGGVQSGGSDTGGPK